MLSMPNDEPAIDGPTALIYEPDPTICAFLRDSLHRMGFQFIDVSPELGREPDIADGALHDLLVVDVSKNPEGFAKKVQEIRRFDPLANPFSLFVMTGEALTEPQVQSLAMSGCDAFISKPLHSDEAREKISRILQADRKFVVSPHYIGPDRRSCSRSGSAQAVILPVPNRAKLKLSQEWRPAFHEEQEAVHRLVLRTVHLTESILWFVRILEGQSFAQPMSQRRIETEILRSAELVRRELQRDSDMSEIAFMCDRILDLAARMRVEDPDHMQLLSNTLQDERDKLMKAAIKRLENPEMAA